MFTKSILIVFAVTFLGAIGLSFYKYFYTKNYDYLVEAPCDPIAEKCFVRDCSDPESCPPNQLSVYKQYYVKAYNFPGCQDNSCITTCAISDACESVACDEAVGDVCTGPISGSD